MDQDANHVNCFDCELGFLETKIRPYEAALAPNNLIIVHNVPHEVCNVCGSVCFSMNALDMIEKAITATGFKYRK